MALSLAFTPPSIWLFVEGIFSIVCNNSSSKYVNKVPSRINRISEFRALTRRSWVGRRCPFSSTVIWFKKAWYRSIQSMNRWTHFSASALFFRCIRSFHDFFLQTYCFKEDVSREKPCISRIWSTFHQLFLSYNSKIKTPQRLILPALRGFLPTLLVL